MSATITVIVFSYNRPRMLAEALESIKLADEILVIDDGSTFDVDAVVQIHAKAPRVEVLRNPPTSVELRMKIPRVGGLANRAIRAAQGQWITYLCDDDIFEPQWLTQIRTYADSGGKEHWVKGWWGVWNDGEQRVPIIHRLGGLASHGLTTGSFAHLKGCALECGVLWSETSVAVHDAFLVQNLERVHILGRIPNVGLAGWRREHRHNMLKYTTMDDKYRAGADGVLGGMLE